MQSPLRYLVYEYLKNQKAATDDEILEMLNKTTSCSKNELNKVLMHLEILGIVSIRWAAKDKRRVEFIEAPAQQQNIVADESD